MKRVLKKSGERDSSFDAPLKSLGKRLPYEAVAAALFGICSLDYRVVIAVFVPVLVDIAQAWIRTYSNLK